MTTLDIFWAVVVVSSALGLLMFTLSCVGITGMTYIANATANIPSYYNVTGATAMFSGTEKFLMSLSVFFVIILIAVSWMLGAFFKASPLSAVVSIVWLFMYTAVAIFVSHYLVATAKMITIYNTLGNSGNLLFLFWANMPTILVIASLVDLAIAVTAAVKS
ncbi:MAG: hypothetical protein RXO43_02615 [Candidatus Micrarchaeota archaeon]